jgi:pseudaminic acid cytidylyltransferase
MNYKRIAIIPARSGSVRVKFKNIKIFFGKPLIEHTINCLKSTKLFHKIHVSTESKKIKKIVEKNRIKVDFLRPKKLCHDKTSIAEVFKYVLSEYKKKKIFFDEVWLFFATNPLIKKKFILEAYKKYSKYNSRASIIAVSSYNYPIEWAQTINGKSENLKPVFPNMIKKRSNLLKKKFCDAGMFVIYQKNFMNLNNKIIYKPYIVPRWSTIDIDTIEDFETAKKLFLIK